MYYIILDEKIEGLPQTYTYGEVVEGEKYETVFDTIEELEKLVSDIDSKNEIALNAEISEAENEENIDRPVYLITQAEQNGDLKDGGMNFSFGNGNEGADVKGQSCWGAVMPQAKTITKLTMGSRTAVDDLTCQVELVIDSGSGEFEPTGFVVTNPAGKKVAVETSKLEVKALDVINFVTRSAGGSNDVVITAWGN